MSIQPGHIPLEEWIDRCFGEIAMFSLQAGVSLEDAQRGVDLRNAIAERADAGSNVIAFPTVRHG